MTENPSCEEGCWKVVYEINIHAFIWEGCSDDITWRRYGEKPFTEED